MPMIKIMFKSLLVWLKRLTDPIVVFILLQVVWLAFVVLWVVWFVNQNEAFQQISAILGSSSIQSTTGIMTLVIGSILLGMILVGTVVLFIFTQVQGSLLRQQRSFVSSVTHELRSPLASLQLSFETMQREGLPETVRVKLFNMVQKDIDRLTRLVDRILLSARLDRGILDNRSQLEVFCLKDLIKKTIEETRHLDTSVHERITIHCPDHLKVRSIPMGMSMILGNLIENAIKYSNPGTAINIHVKREDYELRVAVEDQGFGLNSRDQRKVFKMFHRTPRATRNAVPGTGLGLFIVKSMAKALGGRIWVESEGIGKGSTFLVGFPEQIIHNKD
ncbi:MAG: HAMP domain-containing histidine kinase [Pseudobacteriovorax sp.]|nr:HAMP domain-containing histidine kinase [Pseudobacteriovorax sp.]